MLKCWGGFRREAAGVDSHSRLQRRGMDLGHASVRDCANLGTKEIIVVDDGSKDQTLAVARQFESDQLKVVTQKNQGAAATRNNAFAMSKGDYVQWLDADDLMGPDKTASQMEAAERSGSRRTLISGAWARFMHRPYRAEFRPSPLWEDLLPAEWFMRKMERKYLYADCHVACQPRTRRSSRTMGYQTSGR